MDRDEVLAWLKQQGTAATRKGMARYGIVAKQAYGVPMGVLLKLQKRIGVDHDLAVALWESGWYEARLMAALIGDPERVTAREMNAWAASFENWGDCDTVCFKLWDRSPHAWKKAAQWAVSPREYVKRGGFVLMACLALHDKTAPDSVFLPWLLLLERGAADERYFVKKGIIWAVRSIGGRSRGMHSASLAFSRRLATADHPVVRSVGKEGVRDLTNAKLLARLAREDKRKPRAK